MDESAWADAPLYFKAVVIMEVFVLDDVCKFYTLVDVFKMFLTIGFLLALLDYPYTFDESIRIKSIMDLAPGASS